MSPRTSPRANPRQPDTRADGRRAFRPWRLLHADLSAPFPALPADSALGGVHLVFWLDDVPLGDAVVPAAQLPMTAGAVRALAAGAIAPTVGSLLLERGFAAQPRDLPEPVVEEPELHAVAALDAPLARARALLAAPVPDTGERLSVVICTRDRPADLARCLEALDRSVVAPDEVVVVDNAPASGETRRVVDRWPRARYVAEPRPGLSAARNAGIRASTGEIVAFTDDDVVVHPTWVARVRRAFADPALLAMTGLVLPGALDTEAQVIFEQELGGFGQGFRAIDYGPEFYRQMRRRGVPVWRVGAGANMAFRRRAFALVGEFDERLGAGAAGCSEDSEMWYRLLAAGERCRYEPTAVVHHHHRADPAALGHQMRQYMRGHVAALLVQYERTRDSGNLIRLLAQLPRYYAGLVLRGVARGFGRRHRYLWSEIAGSAAGVGYYLRHRRAAPARQHP
ncbi:MAG TPA: glycosyltransferase [Gemmatimonadaceae bacterium]|nr:glycosyltransferase [Gemmatimonadaceae bacterium]